MANCCQNVRGNKTNKRPKWQQKQKMTTKNDSSSSSSLYYYYWSLSYSAVLFFRADSLRSCSMWFWISDFLQRVFLISTEAVYLTILILVFAWLVSSETAALSAQVLYTPFNHAKVYSLTSLKATRRASSNHCHRRLHQGLRKTVC